MAWCNNNINNNNIIVNNNNKPSNNNNNKILITPPCSSPTSKVACPSCGNPVPIQDHHQGGGVNDLPGLPAGVKFDPTDIEILEHLEAKIHSDFGKLHPLLDEFIPTIEGENGICYTHPEKLPGVSKDGVMRHFFHRPSKAYTTGTRKRRKVHTDDEEAGGETRWHKTGKTRPVLVEGLVKGFKKILVLYTNYGRQRKPEKTNWVMHQYHLGLNEDEKDGELVISKVFYQTQPRQCGSNLSSSSIAKETLGHHDRHHPHHLMIIKGPPSYYQPSDLIPYDNVARVERTENPPHLTPNLVVQGDGSSSFVHLAATK